MNGRFFWIRGSPINEPLGLYHQVCDSTYMCLNPAQCAHAQSENSTRQVTGPISPPCSLSSSLSGDSLLVAPNWGFRKGRGARDQIANICWIIKKARQFQKNIYFCFIDYAKAFDCVDHNKLWKILKEMGIPDHLTCLLRNVYAGQEGTVRTGHGTTEKEYVKDVYCHPAYLTYMQKTS